MILQTGRVYRMVKTLKQSTHTSNDVGITASITQTQGNGQLTSNINFIETVANTNDTVTLPPAQRGLTSSIINHGDNTLQIFPSLGNDLGNGDNISMHLEANEEIQFFAKDSTHWHISYLTEIFSGHMYLEESTAEYQIHAANQLHAYHGVGIIQGDSNGWTFNSGSNGAQIAITSVADAGSGNILVTTDVSHGLSVNDSVSQTGLADTNYVGIFTVLSTPTLTTFTVTAPFTATGIGFMDAPAYLQVDDIAAGEYDISWSSNFSVIGTDITFKFFLHDGVNPIIGSSGKQKFGSNAAIKIVGRETKKLLSGGDRIFFGFENLTDTSNIIPEYFGIIPIKL